MTKKKIKTIKEKLIGATIIDTIESTILKKRSLLIRTEDNEELIILSKDDKLTVGRFREE